MFNLTVAHETNHQRPSGWTDKQFEYLLIVTYLQWKHSPAAERTVRRDPWASCESKRSKAQRPIAGQKRVRAKLVQKAAELSKRFHAECGEELRRRLDAHPEVDQLSRRLAPNPRWALLEKWLAETTGPELSPEEQAYSWVSQMMEASDEKLEKISTGGAGNDMCSCHDFEQWYDCDEGESREWCEDGMEGHEESMEC